jgi:hypothetical protein
MISAYFTASCYLHHEMFLKAASDHMKGFPKLPRKTIFHEFFGTVCKDFWKPIQWILVAF